jgi:hypothetical protein
MAPQRVLTKASEGTRYRTLRTQQWWWDTRGLEGTSVTRLRGTGQGSASAVPPAHPTYLLLPAPLSNGSPAV